MPRYVYGLPCDSGSSDCADSARLAGLMAMVGHPETPNLTTYLVDGLPVRHPTELHNFANNPTTFSRDQARCFMAGIYAQGNGSLLKPMLSYMKQKNRYLNYVQDDGSVKLYGGDIATPADVGCLGIACGYQKTLTSYQAWWLKAEIVIQNFINPLHEPNQLIGLCYVAGPEYLRYLKKHYPRWSDALTLYWSGWRGEHDLKLRLEAFMEAYK